MADSADLDTAIVAKLAGDATLLALMTDGVYFGLAPNGLTKFVEVSLVTQHDEPDFDATAYEMALYRVKAVDRSPDMADVAAAAARIHVLLQNVPLTVSGYTHMLTRRTERLRYPEVDEIDPNTRWQHMGAIYEVFVSPA